MEERKVRVLLEDINHKFDVIREGIADIGPMKDNIETIKKDICDIKDDIAAIKFAVKQKANIQRVEKIESDLKVLRKKYC